jgi:hypothetical protein
MLLIFSPPPLSSPVNGEEALEETFLIFFLLSLPLRERTKVRGDVNSFSPPPLSSPVNGEEVFKGIL